jgi:2-dehydro-3-deoxygluconokinase
MIDAARRAYGEMLSVADIILASTEDLMSLYGNEANFLDRLKAGEVVLKLDEPACIVRANGAEQRIEAEPIPQVVDTTAAGDSFAAAYLAARFAGCSPIEAARAGHRLAGAVVGHRGAIIPRDAMPSGIMERSS